MTTPDDLVAMSEAARSVHDSLGVFGDKLKEFAAETVRLAHREMEIRDHDQQTLWERWRR